MTFDFITNTDSRYILEDTYETITELDLWDWLTHYHASNQGGCIFNNHPNFKLIENNQNNNVVYTGYSWNWVMNIMVYIAVHDINAFKEFYLKKKKYVNITNIYIY